MQWEDFLIILVVVYEFEREIQFASTFLLHYLINYGQWSHRPWRARGDGETIEELKKQPGFDSESPYWEGIAENEHHLYEVVYTEPPD
ncbi:hypothetical protein IQ238_02190 [Pleurocapsales cyanobacterium LEGE 06147]|nr:hypothetical protein [Pleurocapsales cyanobacterium LEGE 06147]